MELPKQKSDKDTANQLEDYSVEPIGAVSPLPSQDTSHKNYGKFAIPFIVILVVCVIAIVTVCFLAWTYIRDTDSENEYMPQNSEVQQNNATDYTTKELVSSLDGLTLFYGDDTRESESNFEIVPSDRVDLSAVASVATLEAEAMCKPPSRMTVLTGRLKACESVLAADQIACYPRAAAGEKDVKQELIVACPDTVTGPLNSLKFYVDHGEHGYSLTSPTISPDFLPASYAQERDGYWRAVGLAYSDKLDSNFETRKIGENLYHYKEGDITYCTLQGGMFGSACHAQQSHLVYYKLSTGKVLLMRYIAFGYGG